MNVILCPDKEGQSPKAQLSPPNVPVLAKRRQIAVGSSFKASSPDLPSCHPWGSQAPNPTGPQSPQFSSVAQLCLILCDPMYCSTPGFSVHHQLPELTQVHVHWVVMPSRHLLLCCPLFLLPSVFPASGSFPLSQSFTSGGQSIGVSASASVLPTNIQDWFPLGLTGLIFLLSKGLSSLLPTPQFKSINSSALSFLYNPTQTPQAAQKWETRSHRLQTMQTATAVTLQRQGWERGSLLPQDLGHG